MPHFCGRDHKNHDSADMNICRNPAVPITWPYFYKWFSKAAVEHVSLVLSALRKCLRSGARRPTENQKPTRTHAHMCRPHRSTSPPPKTQKARGMGRWRTAPAQKVCGKCTYTRTYLFHQAAIDRPVGIHRRIPLFPRSPSTALGQPVFLCSPTTQARPPSLSLFFERRPATC